MGRERFTWASLLYPRLAPVSAYVLYFPSRFDLAVDRQSRAVLRTFGANSSRATSVNFWDPADPSFDQALSLFHLEAPPALVLVTGLSLEGIDPAGPSDTPLYSISFTDTAVLADRERLARAVNAAHAVILRGDPREITREVRKQDAQALTRMLGRIAVAVRDQLVQLKPKIGLPGGASVGIG
jgi:hypothetical protein